MSSDTNHIQTYSKLVRTAPTRASINLFLINSTLDDNLLLLYYLSAKLRDMHRILLMDDTNLDCKEYFDLKWLKQIALNRKYYAEITFKRLQKIIPKQIAETKPKNFKYIVGNKPIEYSKYYNEIIIYTDSYSTKLLHMYISKFRFKNLKSILNLLRLH